METLAVGSVWLKAPPLKVAVAVAVAIASLVESVPVTVAVIVTA